MPELPGTNWQDMPPPKHRPTLSDVAETLNTIGKEFSDEEEWTFQELDDFVNALDDEGRDIMMQMFRTLIFRAD